MPPPEQSPLATVHCWLRAAGVSYNQGRDTSDAERTMPDVSGPARGIMAGLALLFLCSACGSSSGPRAVLSAPDGFSQGGPVHVDEITDIGVPDLYNFSNYAVRLLSVRPVDVSRAVQVLSVRAYNIKRVGYGTIGLVVGDPASDCPGQFAPAPVSSFIIPAHKQSGWMVVIEFRVTRPGTYAIRRVKTRYRTHGGTGWQYQYLNTTLHVADPPLPGLNPSPANDACGRP